MNAHLTGEQLVSELLSQHNGIIELLIVGNPGELKQEFQKIIYFHLIVLYFLFIFPTIIF